jgi:hypothetical protein
MLLEQMRHLQTRGHRVIALEEQMERGRFA